MKTRVTNENIHSPHSFSPALKELIVPTHLFAEVLSSFCKGVGCWIKNWKLLLWASCFQWCRLPGLLFYTRFYIWTIKKLVNLQKSIFDLLETMLRCYAVLFLGNKMLWRISYSLIKKRKHTQTPLTLNRKNRLCEVWCAATNFTTHG